MFKTSGQYLCCCCQHDKVIARVRFVRFRRGICCWS